MPRSRSHTFGNRLAEAFIKSCGWASTLLVLVIVVFLFRQGASLFWQSPLERDLSLVVHPSNNLRHLNSNQLRQVLDGQITSWDQLGGSSQAISVIHPYNLEKELKARNLITKNPEERIGSDFRGLAPLLDSLLNAEPGLLIIFQERFLPKASQPVSVGSIRVGDFLTGRDWEPTETPVPLFGAWPLLAGTLLVTIGAILIALLLGPPVALFMAELATPRQRNIIKPLIELLAGIPSVVFGFIGLVVLVPVIGTTFQLDSGSTALAGSMILAIIALPTVISVAEDAIRSTPPALREASLGLGATQWQTIWNVVLPYNLTSLIAAFILGVGRIVGETMAVLMVTGNNPQLVGVDFLASVRTMSAAIAAEMGEAPQGGLHYKALFGIGCLLFLLTFAINLTGELIINRSKRLR
jgi:phosphate transport system permease protein